MRAWARPKLVATAGVTVANGPHTLAVRVVKYSAVSRPRHPPPMFGTSVRRPSLLAPSARALPTTTHAHEATTASSHRWAGGQIFHFTEHLTVSPRQLRRRICGIPRVRRGLFILPGRELSRCDRGLPPANGLTDGRADDAWYENRGCQVATLLSQDREIDGVLGWRIVTGGGRLEKLDPEGRVRVIDRAKH
ncbi:hypothetical protein SEVIR_2G375033v4 [Setaria viridis]